MKAIEIRKQEEGGGRGERGVKKKGNVSVFDLRKFAGN